MIENNTLCYHFGREKTAQGRCWLHVGGSNIFLVLVYEAYGAECHWTSAVKAEESEKTAPFGLVR